MSGDAQPRKRNKDRKKSKKDEEDTPGVHSGIENVQMHVQEKDHHGVGWCAKIVFCTLLAVLGGLVVLIVIENRGGSDLDTPLSESRFADYLQGWVEENRVEDHHDEPHLDHDDHDDEHLDEGEPFPEEKDIDNSAPDENDDLDAEINAKIDDEVHAPEDDDDDEDENEIQEAEEQINEHPAAQEDDDDDDDEDENLPVEEEIVVREKRETVENTPEDDNDDDDENNPDDADGQSQEDDQDQDEFLDDSLPFEEEKKEIPEDVILTPEEISQMVDNMIDDYNELADKMGYAKVDIDNKEKKTEKREVPEILKTDKIEEREGEKEKVNKFDDDGDDENSFEEIVDNDAGEDELLQKLADQEKQKQEEKKQQSAEQDDVPQASSLSGIGLKIGVGILLIVIAHQVIVKNLIDHYPYKHSHSHEETILQASTPVQIFSQRTITVLNTDENGEGEVEVEEIFGVFTGEETQEGDYSDEEQYDEEVIEGLYRPQTFEEMRAMYRQPPMIEELPAFTQNEPENVQKIEPEMYSRKEKELMAKKENKFNFREPPTQTKFEKLESSKLETIKPEIIKQEPKTVKPEPISAKIQTEKDEKVDKFAVKLVLSKKEEDESKIQIQESQANLVTPQSQVPKPTPEESMPDPEIETEPQIEPDELDELEPDIEDYEAEYEDEELSDIEYEEDLEDEELEDEELSDIDDSDLLKRLEAKYGKIEDTKPRNEEEDDDSWTKIPSDRGSQSYMDEIKHYNEQLQDNPTDSLDFYENILKINPKSLGALYGKAKSLDALADLEKSNKRLTEAIAGYKVLLDNYHDKMTDKMLKDVGEKYIEKLSFIGQYSHAVNIHKILVDRFPDEPHYRNQMAVTYLMMNDLTEAKFVLHNTLLKWRTDGFALVHYGFVLKNLDNHLEGAVQFLQEGIESGEPGTQDGRFYFSLGDSLQRLGRLEEAQKVYRKGADLKLFPSEYQRSLYNVERLKSHPFWTKAETTYKDHLTEIIKYWPIIRDEGLKLLNEQGLFKDEQESLRDVGDWKQLDLFVRGQKTKDCHRAPFTCKLIDSFEAAKCKRGQVKFSVMHPGTHVFPHCGPTNCRLRAHLGLKVPRNTFIRVVNETRSWVEGDWLIFDDSFEHEVWHNGTSTRLVLIVDVWHPQLTEEEKQSMSAI